ncbi:GNAT family N-acetyltransferase [Paracoccus sp. TOH]|uniref:GNAT family N-acetyltransferase n=1 Tax=Paracoccus sp. TOH TaxID=1263728 RepID=UPI0025B0A6E9|nr:GNAT family N-acetyltransferase [Paracoccus sp. TOH]WJS86857.1 N-acetyltransferase [Paracoccus sp. TOH]
MSEIAVAREGNRYVARITGIDAEGEITFTRRGPAVISADHTGVPEAMAGRGVARALLDFMLRDARQNGFRIVPLCPYVRGQYARHPEWADLFTLAPGENP